MSKCFQAGTIISLLQGVYEGTIDFHTLSQQGDTGIGTLNGVDGEMIAIDGKYYRISAQGHADIIPPHLCTPFAVVSFFTPTLTFELSNIASLADLEMKIDEKIHSNNLIYMLNIQAECEWIKLRSEACQTCPYRPLAETMPALQTEYEIKKSSGNFIGTRFPSFFNPINVPGYHLHYIDNAKKTGGHVFDMHITKATVRIQEIYHFDMQLFKTEAFATANLDVNIQSSLHAVEKSDGRSHT